MPLNPEQTVAVVTARQQAAAYLTHLLDTNPAYRRRWEVSAERVSRKGVNRTAVARVLMAFLNDTGEAATEIGNERQLLDLVCRALDGSVVTPRTIHWFCRAFNMDVHHRSALESALRGADASPVAIPRVVLGTAVPLANGSSAYRTVSLQEWHTLGPDGWPLHHRTVHLLQAVADRVGRYPYSFDTNEVEVAAVRGARPGPVLPTDEPGIHRVDFLFERPVLAGETRSFEYTTTFHYRDPPPPEFRRACLRAIDGLDMLVQFDPKRVPSTIEWAAWDGLDGPIVDRRPVVLDGELIIHAYHAHLEGAVVGFQWNW